MALFLVRGTFYCRMLPLWEGWDEYAHFAFIQHWNATGTLPLFSTPFSREIDESMRLAPLAHELGWLGPPYLTHGQWWALPEPSRSARLKELTTLSPELAESASLHPQTFYEAQQPPLYYWLVGPVVGIAKAWPIGERVFLARLLGMALASLAIPLAWLAARLLLGDELALFCSALVAVAPGFAIDTSRVANDCLAIPLAALLFWLVLRRTTHWAWIGVVLGACLITKAYLLIFIPALLAWSVIESRRRGELDWKTPARTLVLALVVGGWWYGRNLAMGHTLTGWLEHAAPGDLVRAVFLVNWFAAAHVAAKSFIWFGAWSFLTLKSWIYAVVELATLVAGTMAVRRHGRQLGLPLLIAGCYAVALAYGVVVDQVVHHLGNIPGWYLWSIAPVLAVVTVAGLQRWTLAILVVLALIDLYGAAGLLVPYYAGLVERNHADVALFMAGLERLNVSAGIAFAWIGATLAIPALCAGGYGRR